MSDASQIVVGPGEGETITQSEERDVAILAEREDITIGSFRYGPGEWGPDPHVHREHTDAWFVIEGELTFVLGAAGDRILAPAGSFVAAPANVVHSFGNESGADVRFLNFHTPDKGFAAYMRGRRDGQDVGFDSFDPPEDGGLLASSAIVSLPGEGEPLVKANRVALLKGDLPELSFFEWTVDGPYDGPSVHDHHDQVDSFFVLEGELEMTVEDDVRSAGPGVLAAIPRGVRHTFNHRRDGVSRFLNLHAPDAGFAAFMRG